MHLQRSYLRLQPAFLSGCAPVTFGNAEEEEDEVCFDIESSYSDEGKVCSDFYGSFSDEDKQFFVYLVA